MRSNRLVILSLTSFLMILTQALSAQIISQSTPKICTEIREILSLDKTTDITTGNMVPQDTTARASWIWNGSPICVPADAAIAANPNGADHYKVTYEKNAAGADRIRSISHYNKKEELSDATIPATFYDSNRLRIPFINSITLNAARIVYEYGNNGGVSRKYFYDLNNTLRHVMDYTYSTDNMIQTIDIWVQPLNLEEPKNEAEIDQINNALKLFPKFSVKVERFVANPQNIMSVTYVDKDGIALFTYIPDPNNPDAVLKSSDGQPRKDPLYFVPPTNAPKLVDLYVRYHKSGDMEFFLISFGDDAAKEYMEIKYAPDGSRLASNLRKRVE